MNIDFQYLPIEIGKKRGGLRLISVSMIFFSHCYPKNRPDVISRILICLSAKSSKPKMRANINYVS